MITLKVTPLEGELGLRYHVESRSDPEHPNLVDLAARFGWGECVCKDWQCNIWPAIRDETAPRFTKTTTCDHVSAAAKYFFLHALDGVIELHNQQET